MKRYDVYLKSVMYCRVSLYAESIDEVKEKAMSMAENNEIMYDNRKITLVNINEFPCSHKEITRQKMMKSLLDAINNDDSAMEFFQEAFNLGLIKRMPK